MNVLYEDNHIIVINKAAGEIVQGDKTGDKSLCDTMKAFLKEKYAKPGNSGGANKSKTAYADGRKSS